ncbi:MAG: hypothetical protein FVQ83_06160 [Chloroflexi bacterium]|nr:hypothetical protein [Chloroflexota bacterium]
MKTATESANFDSYDKKIAAIIDYLHEQQKPNGGFRTLQFFRFAYLLKDLGVPTEYEDWYELDYSIWCTSILLYHLHEIDDIKIAEIKKKGSDYLEKVVENGVVRYLPGYKMAIWPTDVDDTGIVFAVLRQNGYQTYCNEDMIFANHDGKGNLYTWFVPRIRHLRHLKNFFWLAKDYLVNNVGYSKQFGFSVKQMLKIAKEYHSSTESAITANVFLYLGVDERTEIFLKTMIQHIEKDDAPIQYYPDLLSLYFQVARLYATGVKEIESLKDKIVNYVEGRQDPDGSVGGPFDTAIAALTLIYFQCWNRSSLNKAVNYIANHEMHAQGWKPFHACNDIDDTVHFGGPELTATMYLEILYRYQRHLLEGHTDSAHQTDEYIKEA